MRRNDRRGGTLEAQPRRQYLAKSIMFTNVFAKVMVAVPHRSGVCPFQINFVTSAFLDWIFMIVKGHLLSLFDARVIESVGRMKVRFAPAPPPRRRQEADEEPRDVQQGYESRHVVSTVFIHTLMALMRAEAADPDENDRSWFIQPAVDATLACRLNPLAMTEVLPPLAIAGVPPADPPVPSRQAVPVAHSLLTRGVHSGMISIVSCLVQALHVPVVSLPHLWAFFSEDEVRARVPPPVCIYDAPPPPPSRSMEVDRDAALSDDATDEATFDDDGSQRLDAPRDDPRWRLEDEQPEEPYIERDHDICDAPNTATWGDRVEDAEAAPPPPTTAASPPKPAAAPLPPPAPSPLSQSDMVSAILQRQSARISQLEDVVNRFQMIIDQSLGRLDGDVQRLTANHSRTTQALTELRTARDAIFAEIGPERMQERLRAPRVEPQFGQGHVFRGRGGSAAGGDRGGAYEPEFDDGRWQQQQGGRRYRGGGRR